MEVFIENRKNQNTIINHGKKPTPNGAEAENPFGEISFFVENYL